MAKLFKGQWGLDQNGVFRSDPWYLIQEGKIVQTGYDLPPSGYESFWLPEGVVIPGFVNAHTHLELSWMQNSETGVFGGVHEFAKKIMTSPSPGINEKIQRARECLNDALSRGTFYFVDICNSAEFSQNIYQEINFQGLRFLELLGFSDPNDQNRIKASEMALKNDHPLHLAAHSIYGSSPKIFSFIKKHEREIVSIHLLEERAEEGLFHENGKTFDFLNGINQYTRHPEIYQKDLLKYLSTCFNSDVKLLLVHMNFANAETVDYLEKVFPLSALVLCHRSNINLGYFRENWNVLEKMNIPLLLGTDSCASSPDLSILNEIERILSEDVLPPDLIWKAATVNAYKYFNLTYYPYFLYSGAHPEIQSLVNTRPDLISTLE